MTKLIVWRHGRTAWNHSQRMQGQTDVDLDDVGIAQANEAALRLAVRRPTVIISSDLRRASRTAEALAAVTSLAIDLDPRLRERDFGPWQGLTTDEIRERYPDDYLRLGTATPISNTGIETVDDMAKRVGAALRDAAERAGPEGTAVVVTHGGAARVGCGGLLGWPPAIWHTLSVLGNCRVSELRHTADRGWQLHAHNRP